MTEFDKMMNGFKRMMNEANYDEEEYLIDIEDCDGDRLTIAKPYGDDDLMIRIGNDESITGFIVTAPEAMIIVGCLMRLITQWDFQGHIKDVRREAHYMNRYYDTPDMTKPDPEDEDKEGRSE